MYILYSDSIVLQIKNRHISDYISYLLLRISQRVETITLWLKCRRLSQGRTWGSLWTRAPVYLQKSLALSTWISTASLVHYPDRTYARLKEVWSFCWNNEYFYRTYTLKLRKVNNYTPWAPLCTVKVSVFLSCTFFWLNGIAFRTNHERRLEPSYIMETNTFLPQFSFAFLYPHFWANVIVKPCR